MHANPRKLEKLQKRLQQILHQNNLQAHRSAIQQISDELQVDASDCAAALLYISQPHLFENILEPEEFSTSLPQVTRKPNYRTVRYRLDVGSKHQIEHEQLLAVLVEESGVDRKRIARLDMRDTYTLVDLPDGMPADIFQLLSEATVKGHPLSIKRLKANRKKFRDSRRGSDQKA
ncbi:MAG: hypothetical protein CTY19_12190 [Methylomonas sp.]|nr:MAG: hypothetical protein CTY19_12190 [Methylomonas sp.]